LDFCSREASSNSFEEVLYVVGKGNMTWETMFVWKIVFFFLCYQLEKYEFVLCITFFPSQKFDLSVEYNKWQKLLSGSLYEYLGRWLGKEKDK